MKRTLFGVVTVAVMAGLSFLAARNPGVSEAQLGKKMTTPVSAIAISTVTYGRVAVSTLTATRVDNAIGDGLMSGRVFVRVCNMDTSIQIHCGFDANISTISTSGRLAEVVEPSDCKNMNVSENITIYCLGESHTASIVAVVTQGK